MKGIKIKKLQLNKQTVSSLNDTQMSNVKGGGASVIGMAPPSVNCMLICVKEAAKGDYVMASAHGC